MPAGWSSAAVRPSRMPSSPSTARAACRKGRGGDAGHGEIAVRGVIGWERVEGPFCRHHRNKNHHTMTQCDNLLIRKRTSPARLCGHQHRRREGRRRGGEAADEA